MGLKDIRQRAIAVLTTGRFQHEERHPDKNYLAVSRILVSDVIKMINGCHGEDYSESPHHRLYASRKTMVHVMRNLRFKSGFGNLWYVKFYFLSCDETGEELMFISVHPE